MDTEERFFPCWVEIFGYLGYRARTQLEQGNKRLNLIAQQLWHAEHRIAADDVQSLWWRSLRSVACTRDTPPPLISVWALERSKASWAFGIVSLSARIGASLTHLSLSMELGLAFRASPHFTAIAVACPNIQSLVLHVAAETFGDVRFSTFPHLRSLTVLDFSFMSVASLVTGELLASMSAELACYRGPMIADAAEIGRFLDAHPALRDFEVRNVYTAVPLSIDLLRIVADHPAQIRRLRVIGCDFRFDGDRLPAGLVELDFTGEMRIADEGMLSDATVVELCGLNQQLQRLALGRRGTKLTLRAFEAIGKLRRLEAFEIVCDDRSNAFDDRCVLAMIGRDSPMRHFRVDFSHKITDTSIERIGDSCPDLRYIRVGDCSLVTARALRYLMNCVFASPTWVAGRRLTISAEVPGRHADVDGYRELGASKLPDGIVVELSHWMKIELGMKL